MASRGETKTALLRAWLAEHRPASIGETEFAAIRAVLGSVSDSYLRKLLRSCDLPLHPLIEGVVQDNPDALARTLLALEAEYRAGDAFMRHRVRDLVITAKEHCRWALRRMSGDAEVCREKEEALLWMLTWLENPPLFGDWLAIRRRAGAARVESEP